MSIRCLTRCAAVGLLLSIACALPACTASTGPSTTSKSGTEDTSSARANESAAGGAPVSEWTEIQPGVSVHVESALEPITAADRSKYSFGTDKPLQWLVIRLQLKNDTLAPWIPMTLVNDKYGAPLWGNGLLIESDADALVKAVSDNAKKTTDVLLHYPVPAEASQSDLVYVIGRAGDLNVASYTKIPLGQ